jgi:hypothetical protein
VLPPAARECWHKLILTYASAVRDCGVEMGWVTTEAISGGRSWWAHVRRFGPDGTAIRTMIVVKDEVGISRVPFERRQSYRPLAFWAGIDDRQEHGNSPDTERGSNNGAPQPTGSRVAMSGISRNDRVRR